MHRFVFLLALIGLKSAEGSYEPNWESLDSRPLPDWYDEAKIGIFLHWGVFSVPSVKSEWFWNYWKTNSSEEVTQYIERNFPPGFTYQEFAKQFTAEFFDPDQWAQLFKRAGAKYVVLTSKHHEGYTLWPSQRSFSWNSLDIGPHRDLVGELGKAVKNAGLKYGLYHSLFEWFNPLYKSDGENNHKTQDFVNFKTYPELLELVNNYEPSLIWSDGEMGSADTYWRSQEFLAWLYNESPVKDEVVVNDRWGDNSQCNHGGYYTCSDRYDPGVLQGKKWENAMTIDKSSWGFRRNARLSDYLTLSELLTTLTRTVSCGGNILINIGPTKDGIITPIFEERLIQLGEWLDINGEAIYGTKPWIAQNDTLNSNVWYTSKDKAVYAIDLEWPESNRVTLGAVGSLFTDSTSVVLLGNPGALTWNLNGAQVDIQLPDKATVKSQSAWVLKITL